MDIKRLKANVMMQVRFCVRGHILNPLWRKRKDRRKVRTSVVIEEKLRYFDLYRSEVMNMTPEVLPEVTNDNKAEKVDNGGKERLFTIWLQGEEQAPPLIKACIRSMHCYAGMPVVVLDEKSISDWISLPDYIIRKYEMGIISRAHFSDICRVELLYRYGGVWADSTALFTSPIPKMVMDQDFFVFMTNPESLLGGSYAFIQNCFIRAKKGTLLISFWRNLIHLYWKNENKLIDYFAHQMLFRYLVTVNDKASESFSKMPKVDQESTHALFWAYKDEPYDEELFKKVTAGTFFQKTTFKDPSAANPKPGSFAERIIRY